MCFPLSRTLDSTFLDSTKVGWGDCAEDVMNDPLKPLEEAFDYAWDSTAEVIGVVTDTVVSDIRQVSSHGRDALGYAWDSTADVVYVVADTVASDIRQVSYRHARENLLMVMDGGVRNPTFLPGAPQRQPH